MSFNYHVHTHREKPRTQNVVVVDVFRGSITFSLSVDSSTHLYAHNPTGLTDIFEDI